MRPGGHQRWTEVSAANPGIRVHIYVDLTDVVDGELLDGLMHVTGQLQDGVEPFETTVRVEFCDEADGRTRLKIRQWLPEHLSSPPRRCDIVSVTCRRTPPPGRDEPGPDSNSLLAWIARSTK